MLSLHSQRASAFSSFLEASFHKVTLLAAFLLFSPLAASANTKLISPVYSDYNTFLNMTCILELISVGTQPVNATVRVFQLDGQRIAEVPVTIPPGDQRDLIVNDLVGNQRDTYGVVEIVYNSSNTEALLDGRMSFYRTEADDSYSFAFSRQLNQTRTGVSSFGISNSFDPQDDGYLVPNWLQLINLSSVAKEFTVTLYDFTGAELRSTEVTLAAFERRDFPAGHELGRGVYLNEVVPTDMDASYLAGVTRYGANTVPGAQTSSFQFAVSQDTLPGASNTRYVLASNLEERGSFEQLNWIELANTSATAIEIEAIFYGENGARLNSQTFTLGPKSQNHLLANQFLLEDTLGSVAITTDTSDSLLVQSSVYTRDDRSLDLETVYLIPSSGPVQSPLYGSFNRFLEMENELVLVNISNESRTLSIRLRAEGEEISENSARPTLFTVTRFDLNNELMFGTDNDTFGTVELDAGDTNTNFIAYVLRSRRKTDGSLDFVNPTVFR